MAALTVWTFDSAGGADAVEGRVLALADRGLVSRHDAATVSWPRRARRPTTRRLGTTPEAGALGESFWGLLLGVVFFVPLLGAATGSAAGPFTGSLADVGIDDTFVNRVRDRVGPGTSALFLLASDAALPAVREAFTGADPAFTTLDDDQEAALREVFAG